MDGVSISGEECLNDLPLVGLGTYQMKGDECETAVRSALHIGYRLIDTARCYKYVIDRT
jgi:2,5-diketo-D-gluconate reductase A